jgi:hypothetical protein
MWRMGAAFVSACLQGHTEPQTPQNPPMLTCGWLGGTATGATVVAALDFM